MNVINRFDNKYAFLSNFYESTVSYNGIVYQNSEAAFQHAKCSNLSTDEQFKVIDRLFNKTKILIMPYVNRNDSNPLGTVFSKVNPSIAKRLGRAVPIRDDWDEVKYSIMNNIVYNKFNQHKDLRDKLLSTGDAQLIEGNYWHDNTWGVCNCDKCAGMKGSNGNNNNLGKILMDVREKLRNNLNLL